MTYNSKTDVFRLLFMVLKYEVVNIVIRHSVAVARNTRRHQGDVSGDTSLKDALISHRARWAQRSRPPHVQGPHTPSASPSSSSCS